MLAPIFEPEMEAQLCACDLEACCIPDTRCAHCQELDREVELARKYAPCAYRDGTGDAVELLLEAMVARCEYQRGMRKLASAVMRLVATVVQ